MDTRTISDMERNNKTAMYCHLFEALLIAGTFIGEFLLGSRTFLYALLVVILAMAPVIAEFYFWSRNHEHAMIKHLVAQGFAVMYTFILFTTTNCMTFLYVIPMVLVISVYNDTAYALKIDIGIVLENIIVVIGGALTGKFGFRDMGSGLLQLMVIILVGVYSYLASRTSEANSKQKLENIREAQSRTENVLGDVSRNAQLMRQGIDEIHEKVERLQAASQLTKEAMGEVTSGATETAEAVQKQMEQTEQISGRVDQVNDAVLEIAERMKKTLSVLDTGKQDVDTLVREVETSVQDSVDAAEKLETLNQYIAEMNTIVELISGITSQTSLLALNASIEAARAGEAGRGFAVVATEISALATQTKDATAHITDLINNVAGSITEVVTVIRNMIEGINAEKESTGNTAASFGTIEEHTYAIRDNVEHLTESVEQLKDANQQIANSIQTISAVSEEVSAHANETLEAEEENMQNLLIIAGRSQELIALTQEENGES